MLYHHHENFILPISHDEVVHGKGSLLSKMPGDDWQKFANVRVLLAYQWLFPGKKLLMMGCEFGQRIEWNPNACLDWWVLDEGRYHRGLQRFVQDLNGLYQSNDALWECDYDPDGFYWLDASDHENSVLSFVRQNSRRTNLLLVIVNLTPVPRGNYRLGLPRAGFWEEALNTDSEIYGGSNQGNLGGLTAQELPAHHQPYSAEFMLPPLSITVFRGPYGGA